MSTGETPNLHLITYDAVNSVNETFLSYRNNVSGTTNTTNLFLIDSAYGGLASNITSLQGRKTIFPIELTYNVGTTYYESETTDLGTAYVNNTIIVVKPPTTSTTSVYLNFTNITVSPLKAVYRIGLDGIPVQLSAGDFIADKWYILIYDSSLLYWVVVGMSAQDVRVSGTNTNFVKISSDNSIADSGTNSATFAPAANGVNFGNSHNHAVGGGGGTINYASISNTPVLPSSIASTATKFLVSYNSTTGNFSSSTPVWSDIDKTTSSIGDVTTKNHGLLSDVGNNTHSQIDGHIASTSNPHGVTASQANAIPTSTITTKGDLIVGNATGSPVRLTSTNIGTGYVFSANSSASSGVEWRDPSKIRSLVLGYVASPTPNVDTTDLYVLNDINGAVAFQSPSGTITEGKKFMIRMKDNGTTQALSWNAIYRGVGLSLPSSTVAGKTMYFGFIYNNTDTKWDCIAYTKEV